MFSLSANICSGALYEYVLVFSLFFRSGQQTRVCVPLLPVSAGAHVANLLLPRKRGKVVMLYNLPPVIFLCTIEPHQLSGSYCWTAGFQVMIVSTAD